MRLSSNPDPARTMPQSLNTKRDASRTPNTVTHAQAERIRNELRTHMPRTVGMLGFIKVVFGLDCADHPQVPYGAAGVQDKLSSSDVHAILRAQKEVRMNGVSKVSKEPSSLVFGHASTVLDPPHVEARRKDIIGRPTTRLHSNHCAPLRTYRGRLDGCVSENIGDHKLREEHHMVRWIEATEPHFQWAMVPREAKHVAGQLVSSAYFTM